MTTTTSAIELAKDLARQFATRADEADRQGQLPDEDIQALKDSGYMGLNIPTEFGGFGLLMRDCLEAHLALSQGSTSTAIVAAMPMQIFGGARDDNPWTDEVYERLCRMVTEDKALVNFVASEPQMGSPSRGGLPATVAEPTPNGDGWVVNGHKTWTTGGRHLSHMLVRVRVGDDHGTVLVLQDTPGVEWVNTWSDALSLRASDSHDVYFKDVVVPADHLLARQAPGGPPPPPNGWFPMTISAVYLGAAIAARNAVIKFALERVPTALGKSIATLPKIQRQIGEIDIALQAATCLLLDVAAQWEGDADHRQRVFPRVAAAKSMVTTAAGEATEKALQIAGGTSITKSLPLERFFRDVRAGSMQPPSGDTALEMVGRAAIEAWVEEDKA
ncbi:MAG: acyl-CoA/acyl-ACP dehydrogenase [Anaerolineae bacterium]|nr:acyl-CoA/acyl-ACP dehydrogenase [Anaerolineae bacterium]